MADEATRAVGVPPGMPVGWIAPESAILDPGDLQTMRDGLRAGKTVAIASDGHVYVSGEATGQPMTPEAQQFIESRLGVVKQLVDMSGGMTIQPDGRMFGTFANQSIKVAMGPDPSLDQDEMNLVHAGIASGATVAVLPDGSVQYQLQPGTQPPSAEEAQQRMATFDDEVNSGRLGVALSAGHAVRMSGDVYQTMPPPTTPQGMEFPRGGDSQPSVPPTTPPLPGATPESAVGPQTADATAPAPDQTAPAPDQSPTGADAAGETAVAAVDPTVGDVSGADGAALAYDDGSGSPLVDTSDPMPTEAFAADGATYESAFSDGAGDDSGPTETGLDGSYVSSGDAYAETGESYADSGDAPTATYDDGSAYDTGTAYDTGSSYDGASYDNGSAYDTGAAYDTSSYDTSSYGDSATDDGGGDSYSYAGADGSAYDGGSYDSSGDDSSGYDG